MAPRIATRFIRTSPKGWRRCWSGRKQRSSAGVLAKTIFESQKNLQAKLPPRLTRIACRENRWDCGLFRLADQHEGEVLRLHVGLRHALHIIESDCVDQVVAGGDVADAEVVLPEAHQVLGDLGVGVEVQRE